MDTPDKRNPPGRAAGFGGADGNGRGVRRNLTTTAPTKALRRELWIVLNAAHRMAAGYGITWSDFDRLHHAHQFIITVLEVADE